MLNMKLINSSSYDYYYIAVLLNSPKHRVNCTCPSMPETSWKGYRLEVKHHQLKSSKSYQSLLCTRYLPLVELILFGINPLLILIIRSKWYS